MAIADGRLMTSAGVASSQVNTAWSKASAAAQVLLLSPARATGGRRRVS
jgi:hypothetical protein